MADVIDLGAALAAAKATDCLRDVLDNAAAECATGELSAERRAELPFDLIRAFGVGDGVGWTFAKYPGAYTAKPDHVLHKVLCMAADEAAARILSAEGRATLINAVFLAFGGGWRVERTA